MFFKKHVERRGALHLGLLLVVFAWLSHVSPAAAAAAVAVRGQHAAVAKNATAPVRQRERLHTGWRFSRFTSNPDSLSYATLKPWMLASATDFIVSGTKPARPTTTPDAVNVPYAQASFDDSVWETVSVPHDWAIKGPFNAPGVSGGMGRLPSNGVGWYRRNLTVTEADLSGRSLFLDVDGAMSYAAVWLNGKLVGGWPYGYASFRLDLTPYAKVGSDNLLAVRLDNALSNSRWYPGAGIYRNVWLIKVDQTHVGQFGTYITTPSVTAESATVNLAVNVDNRGNATSSVDVVTTVHVYDPSTDAAAQAAVATFPAATVHVAAGGTAAVNGSTTLANPQLWGPPPDQTPHLYVAVTTLSVNGVAVDTYETRFGVRTVTYEASTGLAVNGKHVRVQGTNNHHDHGALGAAFHVRAAERQLEMLQELGCNALRTSHNPPAPELLDLADRMGFVVLDEIFDCWNNAKTTNDFHRIFADWHEADLRAFLRRDRNHPSVVVWSYGNEIGEQTSAAVRPLAQSLHDIVRAEDPTRPCTASMNAASAGSAFADVMDVESLNYQGEGLGTSTSSSFPSFHRAYPGKMIWTSESSSAVSTRGTYVFPITGAVSATAGPASGEDVAQLYVSAYELYATSWGSSPEKVFAAQDAHPYVAGEFVWTGFDYLGEPTPFDAARSSYFGILDLAGFPKDRYYLYQARWRPTRPVAHILPHWTWPDRAGLVTPVHVFAAADAAELFVNGQSAGRLTRAAAHPYRFRWDNVTYAAGDLRVVTYRNGTQWAVATRTTAGSAAALHMTADRTMLRSDSRLSDDLAYVRVAVVDTNGETAPHASDAVTFAVTGAGELAATDNGDPTDMTVFSTPTRKAFNGLALAIVRVKPGAAPGQTITVSASAAGLTGAQVTLTLA
ncbi:Glycoside hydrolase, subgroup, catalytic core [Niveomyces insectorum RCEF 264]|uniref:Glycoside hydrolase, subgroup, catalytic core n=1 Tax=Niveomyces insectorum RCEF 264 TaxID=1081102 RepID=A0A167QXX0_9HYPO|nr:Glycoside hydrolase, subgroup, catalytic core [Niveomyces insectorum RCEF 264]